MNNPTKAFEKWKEKYGVPEDMGGVAKDAFLAGYKEASEGIIGLLEEMKIKLPEEEEPAWPNNRMLRADGSNMTIEKAIQAIRSLSAKK